MIQLILIISEAGHNSRT